MGRRIFCEPRIEYEFPARIWINVSEEVNMKDVCLAILRTFTSNHRYSEPADELIPIVSEYLSMGKFFLVLDDVWTMEAWDQIKKVLPMENEMGKVLVITNVDKVASCVNPERNSHRLRFLTDEESWDLLQLQVFDQISTCPVELCELGKVIAARCKGVPISIVLIGGILIDKIIRTGLEQVAVLQKEWAEVSERMRTYLMNDMHAFMASVISWSYSTLPPGLKYCFLYLGMFPEDTEIPVRKLTQLWIAEGFITHKQGKLLEDTAKDNLKELIDRNLLMVDKLSIIGEVKTCRMHSMIREFCKRQAGAEKENLFQEITMSKQGTFDPPIGDLDHCRRLYIHSHVGEFFQQTPRIPNARTFLCFSKEPIFLEPKDTSMFVEGFGLLRVLDANFIHFPKKFCKPFQLVHLRYLFITFCNEQSMSLPEPMTLLWNLQTLVVNTSSPTLLLKGSIWKMVHLRHFETKASLELVGGKGGGGENLQTLARLSSECLTDELLNKAKNLKKLGIRGKLLASSMHFQELHVLEKLTLEHVLDHGQHQSESPMQQFPESKSFPPTLRFLVLSGTYLDWKHMSEIGQIGSLEVLKLKDNAFRGQIWDVAVGGFKSLEVLSIAETNLMYWTSASDSFPKLRTVELKNCQKLQEVPLELGEKLEKLSMSRVTKYAVFCARKIEQGRAGKGKFKLQINI